MIVVVAANLHTAPHNEANSRTDTSTCAGLVAARRVRDHVAMRGMRGLLVAAVAVAAVSVPGAVPAVAGVLPAVQLTGTSAEIDTFQFVNSTHQRSTDKSGSDFFTFAEHRAPAKVTGTQGSASAFVSLASGMETPGQPPFPTGPLNDIALTGTSTSAATSPNDAGGTPVADSEGTLTADFSTTVANVPVFFDGTLHTANSDASDSCSQVTVDLTGPLTRHFAAFTGACSVSTPHQRSFAQSFSLPIGEYELSVDYESEVDDNELKPMSASATVLLNMSFFPPTARFTTSPSGFTAHLDGSASTPGTAGRPLARWEWNFGDGHTAITTTPTVSHTYPSSPSTARNYTVTLRVVDSGGASSPPVSHTLSGTATTISISKTSTKITASGRVGPGRSGHSVAVQLAKKNSGRFQPIATHRPQLDVRSRYATSFARPTAGSCKLTAIYSGDTNHLASRAAKTFNC
jgi:hypothetical protein